MDTGFGGAAMCARTTTPYARAGVGDFHIEDQRCNHLTSKQIVRYELRVVQLAEYLVRIRVAANARAALGSDTVIIMRSDEGASVSVDEAIARCKGGGRGGNRRRVVEALHT
ncbi:Pyruvate/Phosphoenolpyruvate kinase-like domain-containing protein [Mycena rebaudengoi]|nr:Pyruvate/Phosphoenolpyruvate kinase-like domain-containing protein [Mycena rebaudengoi]